MKKITFTEIFRFSLVFLPFLLFASCSFFEESWNEPVNDYLKKYTETSAVTEYKIISGNYEAASGNVFVSSSADFAVNLFLRNPQNYIFPDDCIRLSFPKFDKDSAEKKFGSKINTSVISIVQDEKDSSILILKYPSEFLLFAETGFDISPEVRLFHPVSKADFGSYTSFRASCDSPPPLIFGAVVYKNPSTGKHVVFFNMPSKGLLSGIHSDIKSVSVNGNKTSVVLNEDGTFVFENNQFKIGNDSASYNASSAPFEEYGQAVYFLTDDSLTDEKIVYAIALEDAAGFSSSVQTTVESIRLGSVDVKDSAGNALQSDGFVSQDESSSYATITLSPAQSAADGADTSDSILVYELYQGTDDSGKVLYSGKNGGGEISLKIPAGKVYLRVYSHKDLYADSIPKEFGIHVLKSMLFVSPDGNDTTNSGSENSPFATIAKTFSGEGFSDITVLGTVQLVGSVQEDVELSAANANVVINGNENSVASLKMSATGGKLKTNKLDVAGSLSVEKGALVFSGGNIGSDVTVSGGNLTAENASVAGSVNIEAGEVSFADGKIDSSLNVKGGKLTSENTSVAGSVNIEAGEVSFADGKIDSSLNVKGGKLTAENTSVAGSVNIENGEVSFADGKIDLSLNVKGGKLTSENASVAGSVNIEAGEVSFSKGTISGDISVSDGTLEIQDCTISKDLNVSGGTVRLKNCSVNGNINYNGGSLVLEGDFALEGSIKIAAGMKVGIKNLAASKNIKISGITETEAWNVGTEVIYSTDGTALSDLICSKFSVKNKDSGGKSLCVVPSSADAKKGVLSIAGVSVAEPDIEQPEYTLSLSPVLFTLGNADNKVSLAVTDSDEKAVTPDSVEFALYQNKNKVAVLQNGLIPSWIPEGKYTVIATAKVGGYSYDVEMNIIISESIAISSLTSAPSASDFPKITASSSADMVKLGEWIKSGSDLEGITITLADDLDLTGCADFDCMGVTKADAKNGDIQGNAFKGVFDGAGHSMTLAITPTDPQPMGLFWQNDGTIMNLTIMQYSSTGQVGSKQDLNLSRGGVICSVNNGTIKNCIVNAKVTSWSVAEIAGIARENSSSGKIVNCIVTGNIKMNCDAAEKWRDDYGKSSGIAAVNRGSIENCVYTGKITTKKVTDNPTYLSNISGAISAYTEGSIANCYWLKDCIDEGGTAVNRIAYINKESGGYGKICIPDPSKITGCGWFDRNSTSASVTAGTTSECKSEQTLAYSGTLVEMLNAYVSASSDSGLKRWTADYSGKLTLDF